MCTHTYILLYIIHCFVVQQISASPFLVVFTAVCSMSYGDTIFTGFEQLIQTVQFQLCFSCLFLMEIYWFVKKSYVSHVYFHFTDIYIDSLEKEAKYQTGSYLKLILNFWFSVSQYCALQTSIEYFSIHLEKKLYCNFLYYVSKAGECIVRWVSIVCIPNTKLFQVPYTIMNHFWYLISHYFKSAQLHRIACLVSFHLWRNYYFKKAWFNALIRDRHKVFIFRFSGVQFLTRNLVRNSFIRMKRST